MTSPKPRDLLSELLDEIRLELPKRRFINWQFHQTIALLHTDDHFNQSFLGLFLDYRQPRDPSARRLVPASVDHVYTQVQLEYVRGDSWIYPKPANLELVTSPAEVDALRARFWELLREIEIDNAKA